MKLPCSIAFFVSASLIVHTVTAIPSLRYFRSTVDNVNRYRIRDTAPAAADVDKNSEDVNAAAAAPPNDYGKGAARLNLKRPVEAVQGLLPRPSAKLRRASTTAAEDLPTATGSGAGIVAPNDASAYPSGSGNSVNPSSAESIPPAQPPPATASPSISDLEAKRPVAERQPYADERDDGPLYDDSAAPEDEEPLEPQRQPASPASPSAALSRLRQFASLNSILANIARIPRAVALQIDSVLAGLQNTYPTTSNVGAYMMGTRLLLRNQVALRPFEMLDRAGFGRLDELVSTMPSVFNPLVGYMERFVSELGRRMAALLQRAVDAGRQVRERARNSLAGVNVARNKDDSYSISVPNLIDMVLKGRLAAAVDGSFALLQRGLSAGLSRLGNSFSSSYGPAAAGEPVRNLGYGLRSYPAFSAVRDYYNNRPSRYYR